MTKLSTRQVGPATAGLAALVLVGFLVTLFGSATKNTVQVFFVPMTESFDRSRSGFAVATTVFAITYAIAGPLTGALADRIGPGRVLRIGSVLAGGAFVVCGAVDWFPAFVVGYGVLASAATTMMSYVPIGVLVDRVFAEGRKGFFYALLTNGTAAGFILLLPLWTWLGQRYAWQTVLIGLGLFLACVLAPLTLVLDAGQQRQTARQRPDLPAVRAALSSALRSSVLWRLGLAFGSCGATMAFIDVHLIAHLHDRHVPDTLSSATMVVLGLCEVVGALVAGRLCDKGAIRSVLIGGYVLRAAAMFLVAAFPSGPAVVVFGVLFGSSFMVTVVATSMWVLRVFPIEVKGTVMGLVWAFHQLAAALVSQLGALAYDSTGSYVPTMLVTGAVTVLAAVTVASLPAPDAPAATSPAHTTTPGTTPDDAKAPVR